ncbi:MAG: hypothetical protein HXX08_11395 [Chloroflexi bacterium]|uniref:Uncharacterized protein n=1 Tax=Candidatus Chlorohelix allophototropha TaxID=3003348 RepID=A0A8T7LWY6_9CHLR|nr:hypothetical protein [Chloroflexota bacterium]WJW65842.1 hypothetical protein OZ401_001621 [Chloroflexota bacterium L227-S17]
MSAEATKRWLLGRFTSSLTAAPVTYPQDACAGILYNAGRTSANTTVYKDAPNLELNLAGGSLAIILNDTEESEEPLTYGGAYGQNLNTSDFMLEVYWIADFTGDPVHSVSPAYTSQAVSDQYFRKLLEAIKQTLRLATYVLLSNGAQVQAQNWNLVDPDSGQLSTLMGEQYPMKTYKQPARQGENSNNLVYAALIEFGYKETLRPIGN